jgi:hypothetical protein
MQVAGQKQDGHDRHGRDVERIPAGVISPKSDKNSGDQDRMSRGKTVILAVGGAKEAAMAMQEMVNPLAGEALSAGSC